jgi:hypothetical protein
MQSLRQEEKNGSVWVDVSLGYLYGDSYTSTSVNDVVISSVPANMIVIELLLLVDVVDLDETIIICVQLIES